ncbi:peptidoglycan D,D-transpeptidase FtsI family protein [Corynebacterium crudilactis]|uniref:Cell division protein FtsI n=1 Tax=Corynebacterium crudilactis TaxID=1652495 RepID=A0A172QXK3_9CORY|nr:penicillin-binding protein 2 [Corynebacterium crudilactis]ANE05368.1 cell division protein FtsI [Corynebacterium crudilactis]
MTYRPQATSNGGASKRRINIVTAIALVLAGVLIIRLGWVQVVWGPELALNASEQRTRVFTDPARRGSIVDREGNQMAYTMQARSLTVSPNIMREELSYATDLSLRLAAEETDPAEVASYVTIEEGNAYVAASTEQRATLLSDKVEDRLQRMADRIPEIIKSHEQDITGISSDEILEKFKSDSQYQVLVRNVDPDIASEITDEMPSIAADHQDIRQYPNGAIGENIIGRISMDGEGQFGFEASNDSLLAGNNGRSTRDLSNRGQAIPGTLRDQIPAIDGANVELTVDLDLQTYVQQALEQAKANSGAESASAVVLDAKTAEVLAMANTDTINPNEDTGKQIEQGKSFDNPSVTHPYEPGSVAKIITAAGVIQEGLTTPDEVLQVPGSIEMAGVSVSDAWAHGVVPYTTAGVFGKSSNVGTLMLAERLGEDKFAEYLDLFGVGQSTGIELPSESQGLLPAREQWSGGTFANLPIGQGMSITTLQMAGIYQALANDGERIEPRIVKSVTDSDGTVLEQPKPDSVKVVSPEAARKTVDMFRSVTQVDPTGVQQGTAPDAAIEGYQISGKTGTAQKVDPNTGAYSNSQYWITFAGIAPADDPRFVVAIMLDEPERGVHGGGGQTAAPLFKDIATWLLNRDNIPLSAATEPILLQAQ